MLHQTREYVAGGPDDFLTVHHLRLSGNQAEIGRALAEEARRRYAWAPSPIDPTLGKARHRWFERNWPQHLARARGAADLAGVELADGDRIVDALSGEVQGGCSASWSPPATTAERHGLIGRNYDFFTIGKHQLFAQLAGEEGPAVERPMASRPSVVTVLPDDGIANTFITMDELDSAMEGVNEYGVGVALLIADAENTGAPEEDGPQVGIASGQLPRFVLDTCRSAQEAREALLDAKHYDLGIPLHYLIADSSGDAFVWERSPGGAEHVTDAGDGPMCVTNHLLHRHPDPGNLPEDNAETMATYERAATLTKRIEGATMSGAAVREALREVSFDDVRAGKYPIRTVWSSVLDVTAKTVSTRFYLGDTEDGERRYSDEVTFRTV